MTRYYPGFLAALFIILLRIAIGWHFLYEGMEKYNTTLEGKAPFSSEIYLRNANGPLAPYFREMLPDVDGRDALDLTKLKDAVAGRRRRDLQALRVHRVQRTEASKRLDEAERWADDWFRDPENAEKRSKYLHDLDELDRTVKRPPGDVVRARAGRGRTAEPRHRPPVADRPAGRAGECPARRGRQARHQTSRSQAAKAPLLSLVKIKPAVTRSLDRDADREHQRGRGLTALDPARLDQRRDHLRPDRDRRLPDPRVPDPTGGAWAPPRSWP